MVAPAPQADSIAGMLLHQAPACWWAVDRELVFHQVYGSSEPLFGAPPEALKGASLLAAFDAEQAADWRRWIAAAIRGEGLDFRVPNSQGRTYRVVLFPLRSEDGTATLAGGVGLDTTAISSAEEELRQSALNVLRAQDLERSRISHFLHDDVAQCLSAAGMHLDLLRMDLGASVPAIVSRTAEIQELLERVMERVREYSNELNPASVERTGLPASLDRLVGRVRRSFQGTLRLMADSTVRVDTATALAVFKIAQEALENAVLHSGCSQLQVVWKSTPGGPALEILDNGKGFDSAAAVRSRRGLGILLMQHNASEAGLDLAIYSDRGRGTTVRATCLPPKTAHE